MAQVLFGDRAYDRTKLLDAAALRDFTVEIIRWSDDVSGFKVSLGEQIRTIHEELPGFDAAMKRFESMPGFDRQWRDAVILPPFATNRTVIYRHASA